MKKIKDLFKKDKKKALKKKIRKMFKKESVIKLIIIIATLALVLTSILPYLFL
jgi:polyferredoxin